MTHFERRTGQSERLTMIMHMREHELSRNNHHSVASHFFTVCNFILPDSFSLHFFSSSENTEGNRHLLQLSNLRFNYHYVSESRMKISLNCDSLKFNWKIRECNSCVYFRCSVNSREHAT